MLNEDRMTVYIVLNRHYEDTNVLGVFSSEEKANAYVKYCNNEISGIIYMIPMEVDKIDEEDDEWFEFNQDYVRYHDEKDI